MNIEKSLVNDKITALRKTNIPPRRYFKRYKQQNKIVMNIQKPQLQFVSIFFTFVHPCLPLHLRRYVLGGYYQVSLNLVAVPTV